MEVGVLSMRYAKAMIEYAQEKGVEDRLYNEFFTLSHRYGKRTSRNWWLSAA